MRRKERSKKLTDIAAELDVSLSTVNNDLKSGMNKIKALEQAGMSREQIVQLIAAL